MSITRLSENLRADGIAPQIIRLHIPTLPIAPPLEAPLPEVHQPPVTISFVDSVNEGENRQLPSGIDDAPTSDAPHVVGAQESVQNLPLASEPHSENDKSTPLMLLTDSSPYPGPHMRFPTPEEEKPTVACDLKTAEEDAINSQIKQLQVSDQSYQNAVA